MTTLHAPSFGSRPKKAAKPVFMTEQEFIDWNEEGVRAEWVDGQVEFLNAVALDHADLAFFLARLIAGFFEENDLGKVWNEPYQVRLGAQKRRRLPDIFFASTSRLNLVERHQFNGAPDLIVEVVSPDGQTRDRRVKFNEYQKAGVQEYWLPDPRRRTIDAYSLDASGRYQPLPVEKGQINSLVLRGLFVKVDWVYQLKLPKTAALIQQMTRNRKKLLRASEKR